MPGTRGPDGNRCSMDRCNRMTKYDLILFERKTTNGSRWYADKRETIDHVYLCEEHGKNMVDFLSIYKGGK